MKHITEEYCLPLMRFWWVSLPKAAARVSAGLLHQVLDGYYLVAWPSLSAFLTPLVFLLGLFSGGMHPGFEEVFSESLLLILFIIFLGVSSGHLGLAFLAGFALGDFFLFHTQWTMDGEFLKNVLAVRIPLIIEYGLLAFPLVTLSLWTKALVASVPIPRMLGQKLGFPIMALLYLVLTFVLVFFWVSMVPLLIRPIFTWQGNEPKAAAVVPMQERGLWLAIFSLIPALWRLWIQVLCATDKSLSQKIEDVFKDLESSCTRNTLFKQIYPWNEIVWGTFWPTLLLSGLYANVLDALFMGLLYAFFQAARHQLIPIPLGSWPKRIARVPLLFRLSLGFICLYGIGRLLLATQMSADSFRSLLVLTGAGLVILFYLNPRPQEGEI